MRWQDKHKQLNKYLRVIELLEDDYHTAFTCDTHQCRGRDIGRLRLMKTYVVARMHKNIFKYLKLNPKEPNKPVEVS